MQAETFAAPGLPASPISPPPESTPARYLTLDAFRGFVMLMLCSRGFGFGTLSGDPAWRWVTSWFDHVEWEGIVFWDLIQPAFMFMVGAAIPFALARRTAMGATRADNFRHAAVRAFRLVLLSQILSCIGEGALQFQLINVLAQMAFTYFFAFVILEWRFRNQLIAAAALLAGHAALFALFPGADGAYSKDGNIGAVIDRWWLGRNYSGYYVTINFISSTVTTLFGGWAAMLIRSERSKAEKLRWLAAAMAAAFASGLLLALAIPNVKRLWTASFTLSSVGWVLAMLIVFYWVIDLRGWTRWTFPLTVLGMNSIFIYSLHQVQSEWINRALGVFTGNFAWLGKFGPVAQACGVLLVMWYLCYWLYQRRIFLRL